MPEYQTFRVRTSRTWISYITGEYRDNYSDLIPVSIGRTRVKMTSAILIADDIYTLPDVTYVYFPLSQFTRDEQKTIAALVEMNRGIFQEWAASVTRL